LGLGTQRNGAEYGQHRQGETNFHDQSKVERY
jgi:hypothetical protein